MPGLLDDRRERMRQGQGRGQGVPGGLLAKGAANVGKATAQSLWDMFTLPGDVLQGKPFSQRDVTEFALEFGLLGAPVGKATAPRNSLGMFAGKSARTADWDALEKARRMDAEGKDAKTILEETGWFKGADGEWRFEIDDSAADTAQSVVSRAKARAADIRKEGMPDKPEYQWTEADWEQAQKADQKARQIVQDAVERTEQMQREGRAGDVLVHPDLYAAYPELAEYTITPRAGNATFYPGEKAISYDPHVGGPRESLLHEMQHGIQEIEGFSPGADVRLMDYGDYRKAAGEVEARNVSERSRMTPKQRRAMPPWATEDVPRKRQTTGNK